MQTFLGLIAFAVLIAAQFMAVVCVRHDVECNEDTAQAPQAPEHKDARTRNTWLSA